MEALQTAHALAARLPTRIATHLRPCRGEPANSERSRSALLGRRQLGGERTTSDLPGTRADGVARLATLTQRSQVANDALKLWVSQRRWHPNWLNDGPHRDVTRRRRSQLASLARNARLLLPLDSLFVPAERVLLLDRAPIKRLHRGAARARPLCLDAGDFPANEHALAGDDPVVAQLAPSARNRLRMIAAAVGAPEHLAKPYVLLPASATEARNVTADERGQP